MFTPWQEVESYLPCTPLWTWGTLASDGTSMAATAISQLHQRIHLLLGGQLQALCQVLVLFLESAQLVAAARKTALCVREPKQCLHFILCSLQKEFPLATLLVT